MDTTGGRTAKGVRHIFSHREKRRGPTWSRGVLIWSWIFAAVVLVWRSVDLSTTEGQDGVDVFVHNTGYQSAVSDYCRRSVGDDRCKRSVYEDDHSGHRRDMYGP